MKCLKKYTNRQAQVIEISDIPAIGEKSIKVTAQIIAYKEGEKWFNCHCGAIIYLKGLP